MLLVNVARLALQLTDNWAFGSALCHVIPTAFAVVVFSSSFNLMMIAVDRYILIVRPLDRRMSPPAALAGVVVVALLATGAALPIAVHADVAVVDDALLQLHRVYCTERCSAAEIRCTEVDLNRSFVKYETVRVVVDKLRT